MTGETRHLWQDLRNALDNVEAWSEEEPSPLRDNRLAYWRDQADDLLGLALELGETT